MNIFIVTSCMKPSFGVINFEDRYTQTLKTFDSIKLKDPNALIVFSDSSVYPLTEKEKETIQSKVHMSMNFSEDDTCKLFNQHGLKSHGENYMLLRTITHLKTLYDFDNIEGRMFKLGGRCELQDSFDINDYNNHRGKYIFKKRRNTWMNQEIQQKLGSTHILETRLYSWCFSLVDEYLEIIHKNFKLFDKGLDTEHSHMLNTPANKLLEYDNLNVGCVMALNGHYMLD